jgi:hypothetical protein
MRATEQQHNTPEQVRQYLAAALEVVSTLDVPDELQAVAFAKAVDLFSAKQVFYAGVSPADAILRPH